MAPDQKVKLELPASVVTVVDLGRLQRELTAIDEFNLQNSIRDAGKQPRLPKVSHSLEELASQNNFNLLISIECKKLIEQLERLSKQAPVIHISFASEPSSTFLSKIIDWFRNEIHPHTVLHIGLQPNLAAGCVVRTTNKYFDFSLRKHFENNQETLIKSLVGSGG